MVGLRIMTLPSWLFCGDAPLCWLWKWNQLFVIQNTFMILMVLLKIFFFGFLGNKQRFLIFCHLFYPSKALVSALKYKQVGGSGNICCFFHDSQVLLYFLKNTNFFFQEERCDCIIASKCSVLLSDTFT